MQEILSKKEIGERIKTLRLEGKLSQSFVANKLQISRSNYSQIELGNQYPSFNTLYLISCLYDKSYEWLLHGDHYGNDLTSNEPQLKVKSAVQDMELTLDKFRNILAELDKEFQTFKRNNRINHIQESEL